jgi:hypothetical protein
VVQKLLGDSGNPGESFLLSDNRSLLDACVDEILKWDSTAYLRRTLLGMGIRESEPWLNDGPVTKALWKCLFREAAYVAAMFHDMGYPWQYVNILDSKLDHARYQSESPTANAATLVSAFGNRLFYAPLSGYRILDNNTPATWRKRLLDLTAKAIQRTHGFPGAIGFLYLNDVLRDFPADRTHPIKQFCVEWAAMAIMMHDMRRIYWGDDTNSSPENSHMRLKFHVDPLSCLITLADILQDFSRPAAGFQDNGASVGLSYQDGCDSARLELDWPNPNRAMKIVYCFSNAREYASKLSFLPGDRKECFDEQNGYMDLSAIGIRGVELEAEFRP